MSDTRRARWYRITPGRFIVALLAAECLLWLSERIGWPEWHKNDVVLIGAGVVAAAASVMLVWLLAALVFRRRFQFGIRALLALSVVVALPCSWMAAGMKQARQQEKAIIALQAAGARTDEDWPKLEFDDPFGEPDPAADKSFRGRARQFFLPVVGEAFFSNVVRLDGAQKRRYYRGKFLHEYAPGERPLEDGDLAWVSAFPQLKDLDLSNSLVTDAGMRELRGLRQLRKLSLWGTRITDAGVESLRGLTELEDLDLGGTRISDAGLKSLAGLAKLTSLRLGATKVSDAGLASLLPLTQLELLTLNDTAVSDAGMSQVGKMAQLETLCLDHTQIGRAGLERLATLSRLENLYAKQSRIDENCAKPFRAKMTKLIYFRFSTRLTAADREAIRGVLRASKKHRGMKIMRIAPAEGGGAAVYLVEVPRISGAYLLMQKSEDAWSIAVEDVWGKYDLPSLDEFDKLPANE
jgi:hypothetical protein